MINYSNRIELFRSLTVDELNNEVFADVFSALLDKNYDDFVGLCEHIKKRNELISDISVFLSDTGEVHFDIAFVNGAKETK